MAQTIPARMSAEIEGDFVVFVIGMRVNKFWKPHKWIPVFLTQVQYWRSFAHLEAYARSHDHEHWPAWVAFNKRMRESRGDVGIWHETYKVRAGEYEAIYSGVPRQGLGKAGKLVPATGRKESARGRISPDTSPDTPAPVVTESR
jgi:hypothetical protein